MSCTRTSATCTGGISDRPRALPTADQEGSLEGRDREVVALELAPHACYAIAALGGVGVLDLDVFVRNLNGAEVARDDRRERDAVAKFCAGEDPRVLVEIRMFDGGGDYVVRVFRLAEPPGTLPIGVTGRACVAYAEALSILRSRSLEARPLAWGFLLPGRALAMPFQVRAGRWKNRETIVKRLSDRLREETREHWLPLLRAARIPCAPVNDIAQTVADEQVLARNMIVDVALTKGGSVRMPGNPIKLSETYEDVFASPPAVGEHTDRVLRDWLGKDQDQIAAWKKRGIVG